MLEEILKQVDFSKSSDGLLPVIVQDKNTQCVLMLAYMNKDSFIKTVQTGNATYWSRSRNEFWIKGEKSGNFQRIKEIFLDCDGDTILLKVELVNKDPEKAASCHLGYKSCFFRKLDKNEWKIISKPLFDPKDVYK